MSAAVSYERVRDHLQRLNLDYALASLDPVLERGQKEARLPVECSMTCSSVSLPPASSGAWRRT
jgi:hypothetical protein